MNPVERFWQRCSPSSEGEHWLWTGYLSHGRTTWGSEVGVPLGTVSCELFGPELAEGTYARAGCGVKNCARPEHQLVCSHKPKGLMRTICPAGHPLDGATVVNRRVPCPRCASTFA